MSVPTRPIRTRSTFPIQETKRTDPNGRTFRIPAGDVPWVAAEIAYLAYVRRYGIAVSMSRLAERGGFDWHEFAELFTEAWPWDTPLRDAAAGPATDPHVQWAASILHFKVRTLRDGGRWADRKATEAVERVRNGEDADALAHEYAADCEDARHHARSQACYMLLAALKAAQETRRHSTNRS